MSTADGDRTSETIRPLGEHRWRECRADLLVIPLGATEQHGPHLPLQVDSTIAEALAEQLVNHAASRDISVLLAPPQRYGASGEHEDFPGTLSIGTAALTLILCELGRSASRWVPRILIVNGHGGNVDALKTAGNTLREEHIDFAWLSCEIDTDPQPSSSDLHAGHIETSLMLALQPETVRLEYAEPGVTLPFRTVIAELRQHGVRHVSPNGILGDPSNASAEIGRDLFSDMVDTAWQRVNRWKPAHSGGMLL